MLVVNSNSFKERLVISDIFHLLFPFLRVLGQVVVKERKKSKNLSESSPATHSVVLSVSSGSVIFECIFFLTYIALG